MHLVLPGLSRLIIPSTGRHQALDHRCVAALAHRLTE